VKKVHDLQARLHSISLTLSGDGSMARREFETRPSLNDRISTIESGMWNTTCAPTDTYRKSLQVAASQLAQVINDLKSVQAELQQAEQELDTLGAPWTPGRTPWKK
jgi:3-phenylpropionate/cinnamic acid dioxygenase small subunit